MANRARSYSIAIRVNEREHEYLESRRAAAGLPWREFLIACLQKKPIVVKPGGTEIIVQLKRIGNNINQLARNSNAGRIADCSSELQQLRAELEGLRKAWQ